jgi:hypothetical protein
VSSLAAVKLRDLASQVRRGENFFDILAIIIFIVLFH